MYLLLALDPLPGFLSIGYGNQSTGKLVILFPKPAIDLFSDLRDSRESLSLKPSFVTRGESDWLLFLRSLHMRQRSKWARFCKASKGQTDNKKTQLGPELARGWAVRRHWNQANWSSWKFSWGHRVPKFHLLPHRRGSGLAEQFSRSEIPSSFLPLSPFHLKSCLYSTDFSRFSIFETRAY